MHTTPTAPPIVVLGAGVIGLTTAVLLQASGWAVTLVAAHAPDSNAPEDAALFASPKAGAHWRSTADPSNAQHVEADRVTLQALRGLVKIKETGVMPLLSIDAYMPGSKESEAAKEEGREEEFRLPWFKDAVEGFKVMDKDLLPPTCGKGFSYMAYSFNTPRYLGWLSRLFRRLGGKLVVKEVIHIDEAYRLGKSSHTIVVNCTGLGARTLGGVEDPAVYPTRGQIVPSLDRCPPKCACTVIVRAPHLKYTITRLGPNGTFDYVIPREDGLVILGGTYQEGNWTMQPDPATADRILRNAVLICPQLQEYPGQPLNVVAHRVGLRPTRKGGIRIEPEWRSPTASERDTFRRTYLAVHNYGHGGGGYQGSWGSAKQVLELVEKHAMGPLSLSGADPSTVSPPASPKKKGALGAGPGGHRKVPGIKSYDEAMRRVMAVGSMRSRL